MKLCPCYGAWQCSQVWSCRVHFTQVLPRAEITLATVREKYLWHDANYGGLYETHRHTHQAERQLQPCHVGTGKTLSYLSYSFLPVYLSSVHVPFAARSQRPPCLPISAGNEKGSINFHFKSVLAVRNIAKAFKMMATLEEIHHNLHYTVSFRS